jgi:DNA-binding cell septation regulator SpoVG
VVAAARGTRKPQRQTGRVISLKPRNPPPGTRPECRRSARRTRLAAFALAGGMTAAIQVVKVKSLKDSGNLKAFASLRIGALVVHRVRIVQQPGQKAWISMPQFKVGEKYYPIVEIESDNLRDRVRDAVREHWQSIQDFRDSPGDRL